MKSAFIDTSALTAILLRQPGWPVIGQLCQGMERLHASNLLEAEMRSVAVRENVGQPDVDSMLAEIRWVLPDRPLSQELRVVASCGTHLRGADAWHLACALFLAGDPSNLPFVTLDDDQAEAASRLGFKVLPEGMPRGLGVHETPAGYDARWKKAKRRAPKGARARVS